MDLVTLFLTIGLIIALSLIGELWRRIQSMNRAIGDTNQRINVLEFDLNRKIDNIDAKRKAEEVNR